MLTVKQIQNGGYETIHTGIFKAIFDPNMDDDKQALFIYRGQGEGGGYEKFNTGDGLFFVMNDRGSTVARYDLGN